jgi:tagatose-6-phosphate ketose/aldose isomerase
MDYFGVSRQKLEEAGGYWTAHEILQQPAVWNLVRELIAKDSAALRAFLSPLLAKRGLRVVLTGAGTSAFIGECAAPALSLHSDLRVEAIPTTDLVGSPERSLPRQWPTLLVSFARSGNSPESVAAVKLAEQCVTDCHHLIFTCNEAGALNREAGQLRNAHVVLLPKETNDQGFAMTSSFSGMLLAAALTFHLLPNDAKATAQWGQWAGQMLQGALPLIQELAHGGFERMVYLGTGALEGLAREAALKTLELSDGRVVAVSETPLGFRHGPKTIVNAKTLVVVMVSNDAHARRYDVDLLQELRRDGVAGRVLALSAQPLAEEPLADNVVLSEAAHASDLALCLPYAAFAQTLAYLQSLALGLRPDMPNARGVVSRVVQGVTIYPMEAA